MSEPPGKPKNTGVGNLSLLQGIFLTQESKLGSPALQANSLPAELPEKPRNFIVFVYLCVCVCVCVYAWNIHIYVYNFIFY